MKTGFFDEAPGVKSSIRLNSFIVLLFLIGFDILLSRSETFVIDSMFITFNFVLLTAIFVPKYLQKFAETKKNGVINNI